MGRQLQQFLLVIHSQPPISSNMMKLILAISLLVTLSMAAPMDDGTDVHNTLIADYCAADDAGRDAILVQLEGWCLPTSKMDDKTRACRWSLLIQTIHIYQMTTLYCFTYINYLMIP